MAPTAGHRRRYVHRRAASRGRHGRRRRSPPWPPSFLQRWESDDQAGAACGIPRLAVSRETAKQPNRGGDRPRDTHSNPNLKDHRCLTLAVIPETLAPARRDWLIGPPVITRMSYNLTARWTFPAAAHSGRGALQKRDVGHVDAFPVHPLDVALWPSAASLWATKDCRATGRRRTKASAHPCPTCDERGQRAKPSVADLT